MFGGRVQRGAPGRIAGESQVRSGRGTGRESGKEMFIGVTQVARRDMQDNLKKMAYHIVLSGASG